MAQIENIGHFVHKLDTTTEDGVADSSGKRRVLTAAHGAIRRHDNVPAVYNRRLGLEIWTVNDSFTFATMLRVPFGQIGARLGGVAHVYPKLTFGFEAKLRIQVCSAFHSHGTYTRDFVLDAKFSARKQFRVRVTPRWIVHHRVHQAIQGYGGPKRVVAQTVAAAWFRTKRNELADYDGGHGTVQIISLHFDAHRASMISSQVRQTSADRHL